MTGGVEAVVPGSDPPVGPPDDLTAPLFVYGLLKPGELAFRQIEQDVVAKEPSDVRGTLRICDGLPMLDLEAQGAVRGWLLELGPGGYDIVGQFEPANVYRWDTVSATSGSIHRAANVLVRNPQSKVKFRPGGGDVVDAWSAASDPVLCQGLPAVATLARRAGLDAFPSSPLDEPGWQRFFELQAAFLLACSVLERVATLEFGRLETSPTARVHRLGSAEDFRDAFRRANVDVPSDSVASALGDARVTVKRSGKDFLRGAYQVRSNIVHRGKGAFAEAELVRVFLVALHDVLKEYLTDRLPELRDAWRVGEADGWGLTGDPPVR